MIQYDLITLEFQKILSLLKDYAKTNEAKGKIEKLVPSEDYDKVISLNEETKEAYLAVIKLGDIPLGGLYDVRASIKRAQMGSTLGADELLNVVGLINCSQTVERYFKSLESLKLELTHLKEYYSTLQNFSTLKTNITLAIDENGKVNDNASKELFTIRRSLQSLQNRLRSKLNEILSSKSSMLTENLIVIRDNRMCLPVKIEYKNTFRGIVHDISSSNTTCYIEPEQTLETTNQIESYQAMEKKEIQTILKSLSLLVGAEADALMTNLDVLTDLDVIYAKALFSKAEDYHEVHITNDYTFDLKRAKHPLIDKDKVVPIDISIGNKNQVIIITGPNTGGKTVALKTVGLLHIMMMCGLMLPCSSESTLSVFDQILADIGDEQSLEQSLSTFSAHLTKMKEIIEHTTFASLILLDELGSGTDPKEGSSLAISMIEYLKKRQAKLIVTTHYSDLKNYAYEQENIVNASVEFNSTTLMPTYRLLIGIPGKSNAIEIANRLGLPSEIIQMANQYMEGYNSSEGNVLLSRLEEEMTKVKAQEEELMHKIELYNSLNAKLSKEKIALTKETDKIIEEANKEAQKMIEDSKEKATLLLNRIKELENKEYKDHELAEIKHQLKGLSVEKKEQILFDEELSVGDYVYIKPYEKNGTITRIKKDKYTVQFGLFSMDFSKTDLVKATKPKEKQTRPTRLSGYNPASHASLSLDLRGKRYEEVASLMDSYIDQAILGNLETVTIIHGFGTGAIRKAVWDYLKQCPYAKSYRFGQEGEGLNGVTVVKLK